MKLHIVSYGSRSFDFEGCGASEKEALDLCIQALRAHGKEYGLDPYWWWEPYSVRSEQEAARMDSGLFGSRTVERGGAYRDKEPI